jgi:L-alanine-DL-glutamate epimerase-like enolase superfamily enzyme
MVINDLEFYLVAIERTGPLPPVRSLLVRLTGSGGKEGWGESSLAWRPAELPARRDALLSVLEGRGLFDSEELQSLDALSCPELRCAVEMAYWDLASRSLGQPLRHFFGGSYRRHVPLAARLPDYEPDRVARVASELTARGFHGLMIAATGDVDLDAATVRAVRDAVGHGVELRLDGQGKFDPQTARELCRRVQRDDLQFFLDPLSDRELYRIAALNRQTSVPLAVWRALSSPRDLLSLVRCGGAAYAVVDPEPLGGLAAARTCAGIAAAAGLSALLGGRSTLGIAIAAQLQLAAATIPFACSNPSDYHELHDDVLTEPLEVSEGMMTVPQGPGLGIEVDRAKVERYAVA